MNKGCLILRFGNSSSIDPIGLVHFLEMDDNWLVQRLCCTRHDSGGNYKKKAAAKVMDNSTKSSWFNWTRDTDEFGCLLDLETTLNTVLQIGINRESSRFDWTCGHGIWN